MGSEEAAKLERGLGRVEGKLELLLDKVSAIEARQAEGHACVNAKRLDTLSTDVETLKVAESGRKGTSRFVAFILSLVSGMAGATAATVAVLRYSKEVNARENQSREVSIPGPRYDREDLDRRERDRLLYPRR